MAPIVDGLEQKYRGELRVERVKTASSYGKLLAKQYGFIGQPTFIFLDRSGQEVQRLMGAHSAGTFERVIERMLAQPTQ